MKLLLSFCLFLSVSVIAASQTLPLSGRVTDQDGKPIPFVSIYIRNTTKGTSANQDGNYRLNLQPGNHEIVFKAVGYRQEIKAVVLSQAQSLDVTLEAEAYELDAVVVGKTEEDPAYAIMRKAIRKRRSYLREVDTYSCEVYIKGLQRLLQAPRKFLGRDIEKLGREMGLDSNRRGIVYLSESESRLSFKQPDLLKDEMISSKVSGSNRMFSFNRASEMQVNFYENYQNWEGISNRQFISPIAENALAHYYYALLGTTVQNGIIVNKIRVTPKRSMEPLYIGDIYIMEDSWRIFSADLSLTKDAGINFADTIRIRQDFFEIAGKKWMPASVRYDFAGGLLGFRLGGYFVALYRNYDLNPVMDKKDFKEILRVTRDVNKKDSLYWNEARPIPLTEEERKDYIKKDALAVKRESKAYLDSLDKTTNRFKPLAFIFTTGYLHRNSELNSVYSFL